MVGETTKQRPPLLPDRRTVSDFFVCDILDAAPKGDMASMEHPVFSISTKPDKRIREYKSSNGSKFIEITPSVKGLATVHDRDVLIFCISQTMAALNDGKPISQNVRFKAYDLLVATNRPTGGESYHRLKEALERLRGTTISTNITTGGKEQTKIFGLVESAEIVRETRDGRMQEVEIKLADWVFNAIEAREVLTLHRDYFRLRKPLERRLYEIARKHCGRSPDWRISLNKLKKKCGSASTDKEFKRLVSRIAEEDERHHHFPDYSVHLDGDTIIFRTRGTVPQPQETLFEGHLDPEAYHDARTAAPGWDVHYLEREWRKWLGENEIEPKHPARHFVKFCQTWHEKRGAP
jgi:plasmid replication initiation protein